MSGTVTWRGKRVLSCDLRVRVRVRALNISLPHCVISIMLLNYNPVMVMPCVKSEFGTGWCVP